MNERYYTMLHPHGLALYYRARRLYGKRVRLVFSFASTRNFDSMTVKVDAP